MTKEDEAVVISVSSFVIDSSFRFGHSSFHMNLFQLVFKQMRQRALSTWLTTLSVLLGVALAIAVMIGQRESGALFGQSDYGYDVIIGAKGSPLQLVLNTVYHIDKSPGNISYSTYEQMIAPPPRGIYR